MEVYCIFFMSKLFLFTGDEVDNYYWFGSDSTSFLERSDGLYNGFSGFRI